MRRKKIIAILLTGVMAIGMLAGCGNSGYGSSESGETKEDTAKEDAENEAAADPAVDEETAEDSAGAAVEDSTTGNSFEGQTITWACTGAGDWDEPLARIVPVFEELTGATVNVELYSHADYLELLQVKLESGSSDYDVIGVDVPLVASYATKDWVASLDPYFTEEEKQQFNESALDAGSWDGVLYAPALNSSSQLLWYNTKLLEEAGVEVPESDVDNRLTWEQIVDYARETLAVVDPEGSNGIAGISFEQVSRTYQMNQIPNSLGGKNIGDDGYTAEGVINSSEWKEGAAWYRGLFEEGLALKGINAEDASDYFKADKVLFFIAGTWTNNGCLEKGMEHFAYAPVPAYEGHEDEVGTPTGSWHLGIPKNSENQELAAEFIKFMTIGDGNRMWLERGDVPSTVEGVENLLESDDAEGFMKIAAYESANTAVPRALTPAFTEYDTIIENMWEDVKNGADVEEALDNAASKIETVMEKYK